MAGSGSVSSTWAPLRTGLFRTLWIAALASNVGEWMQTVGAQWLLIHGPHAAVLVSLVQTADALPAVLFALVAGVLADIFDRVKLLLAVLAGLTAAGGALTALTALHRMPLSAGRGRGLSCSASRAGKSASGSTGTGKTAPTCSTTTMPRHCPTLSANRPLPSQRRPRVARLPGPGPAGLLALLATGHRATVAL